MIIKFIWHNILYRFGIPRRLISDNGRQFTGGNWVDQLSSVLWALRVTPKEATSLTLFQLVYRGEAVILVEVGVESDWMRLYDEENGERRLMELDLVDEVRDIAAIRLMAYRQRMRHNYNRRVILRSFQVGDLV
ncbi:uncharacterized protein LOC121995088 [Zingiber officinale]|uniref:uncharacterized protein LOC121995088 n=1 Tax=Zingiber officinale TaxID=94328 RepID=UPI001C4CE764|nr:uncharacterized protein LOC121995088 [Zingiber officinale]